MQSILFGAASKIETEASKMAGRAGGLGRCDMKLGNNKLLGQRKSRTKDAGPSRNCRRLHINL